MRNFIEDGLTIDYTVSGTAIKSGEIRVIGEIPAVAVTDGAVGETIAMDVCGVFDLPKGSGAITQGQRVYVDTATGAITATATDNKAAGYAWADAAASAGTVAVKINA